MKKLILILLLFFSLSSPIFSAYLDLEKGDRIVIDTKLNTYEIISYESEQEKYIREQCWKYFKLGFFIVMAGAGWNTRTDYGVIAGIAFMISALSIEF